LQQEFPAAAAAAVDRTDAIVMRAVVVAQINRVLASHDGASRARSGTTPEATTRISAMMQEHHHIFLFQQGLILLSHKFHYNLRKSVFYAHFVNIWNSLPNLLLDASTVNASKARLTKFWSHQAVKFDLQPT